MSTRRLYEVLFGETKNWNEFGEVLDCALRLTPHESVRERATFEMYEFMGDGLVSAAAKILSVVHNTRASKNNRFLRSHLGACSQIADHLQKNAYFIVLMTRADEDTTGRLGNLASDWFEAAVYAHFHHDLDMNLKELVKNVNVLIQHDAEELSASIRESKRQ